jgi:hypothetical protein
MTTPTPAASPRPTPSPNTSGNLGPSAAAQAASTGVPQGTTGKASLIPGVDVGTKVLKSSETVYSGGTLVTTPIYGTVQYTKGSGASVFATLNNQGRIDLLAQLAQIPGLYPRGKAPTQEYLVRLAGSQQVALRQEDLDALEGVMRYADTVGDDYQTSIKFLLGNPNVAQSFFDISGAKGPKKIKTTPAEALAIELEQSMADYLDIKISDKEKKEYATKINALEKKRGGALTSLERNQLLTDAIQEKAKQIFKQEAGAEDSLLLRRGALGATYQLLRENYAEYGLPVDNKTLYKDAINSIRSKQALENTLNNIQLRAEVMMPALKDYIRQGLTPRKALGNYINLKSKLYGIPESEITLDSLAPVWSGDKLMAYADWQKYLYSQPEFKNTELYGQQKLSDARALINNFVGRI